MPRDNRCMYMAHVCFMYVVVIVWGLWKANWDRYRQEVEDALSKRSLPTDCQRDEKLFRTVLLNAVSHHIHTGRHRQHEELVPAEILDVMTRRNGLRI